jgi:hypothetical protein
MREPVPHHLGWTALSTALQPACLRQKQPEPSADGSKARSNKLAADSPLEGGVSCELVSENAKFPC